MTFAKELSVQLPEDTRQEMMQAFREILLNRSKSLPNSMFRVRAGAGQGTQVGGINPSGVSDGLVTDSSGVLHGFVRAADGTITKYDVSGAGIGPGQGTIGGNINPPGTVAGPYVDSSNVSHGFYRTANGGGTEFDVPGAGAGSGQGTFPYCNNPGNWITGWYIDSSNLVHGFLRTA
jgi:hypothetical protein